jgi:signal transduction histidine kinase
LRAAARTDFVVVMVPPRSARSAPSFARRQSLLLLVAVLLPSLVLVGVGARMIVQEGELDSGRQAAARRRAVTDFRQQLLARLERARLRELRGLSTGGSAYGDSAIVLVARVVSGTLVLPWQDDSATRSFARGLEDTAFASALEDAQRAVRGPAPARGAAFRRARLRAPSPAHASYAALFEAHILAEPARYARILDLMALPLAQRDEFGVPFALYAGRMAAESATDTASRARLRRFVEGAAADLLSARNLSPPACYLLRDVAAHAGRSDIAEAVQRRCAELDLGERLASDATVLALAASRSDGTPIWAYWPGGDWLVSESAEGQARVLVAVRPRDALHGLTSDPAARIRSATGNAEPLGPDFPGAYVRLTPPVDAGDRGAMQMMFYVAVLLVVLGLGATSARLLWRDVHREAQVTALRAQFVSGVTHELKTPLTAIRMYAETLREHPDVGGAARETYLGTIVGESERLTRLLDNVLDFSRIERGQRSYASHPLRLDDVVRSVARTMEHPLAQQGFAMRVSLPPGAVSVEGDRDALEQAILNLLTNAMKYSADERAIELSLTTDGPTAVIEVADRGIGIPESEQERIFEQFYRVRDHEGRGITGAGLGLTIVRDVTEAHGGRVTVRSEPDNGTRFAMHIPLAPSPDAIRRPGDAPLADAPLGARLHA